MAVVQGFFVLVQQPLSIDNMGAGRIIRMNYCVIEGSDRIGKIQLLRTCGIFAG